MGSLLTKGLHVIQTKAWVARHRREVAQQIKADKEKQLEPVHRRMNARQRAAQEELEQARQSHRMLCHSHNMTQNCLYTACATAMHSRRQQPAGRLCSQQGFIHAAKACKNCTA